jgi:hypothetical protein
MHAAHEYCQKYVTKDVFVRSVLMFMTGVVGCLGRWDGGFYDGSDGSVLGTPEFRTY